MSCLLVCVEAAGDNLFVQDDEPIVAGRARLSLDWRVGAPGQENIRPAANLRDQSARISVSVAASELAGGWNVHRGKLHRLSQITFDFAR
jgi:hypothetical protein